MRELEGYAAVVTGGPKNIGRAIAMELAGAGAKVAITALSNMDGANAVVKEIENAGGEAFAIACDVTKEADVARLHDRVAEKFGGEALNRIVFLYLQMKLRLDTFARHL